MVCKGCGSKNISYKDKNRVSGTTIYWERDYYCSDCGLEHHRQHWEEEIKILKDPKSDKNW